MIQFKGEVTGSFVLYDLNEVAELLDISKFRIHQAVQLDLLVAVQHGGRWMVIEEEVERFDRDYHRPRHVPRKGSTRRFVPPRPGTVTRIG